MLQVPGEQRINRQMLLGVTTAQVILTVAKAETLQTDDLSQLLCKLGVIARRAPITQHNASISHRALRHCTQLLLRAEREEAK